jgi:hypothetical protein
VSAKHIRYVAEKPVVHIYKMELSNPISKLRVMKRKTHKSTIKLMISTLFCKELIEE